MLPRPIIGHYCLTRQSLDEDQDEDDGDGCDGQRLAACGHSRLPRGGAWSLRRWAWLGLVPDGNTGWQILKLEFGRWDRLIGSQVRHLEPKLFDLLLPR